jgi:hypothetical protein
VTNSPVVCECEQIVYPRTISNLPRQGFVAYRIGDYSGFRAALLRGLPGEVALAAWNPATGDLALQLIEWWAYVSDILTFYNERAANGAYLATATLPGSVERLVQVLGYRPRPGIGARGVLGAVLASTTSGTVTIAQRFAVQSKASAGQQPQVFELDKDTDLALPAVAPVPVAQVVSIPATGSSVPLKGRVGVIRPGDLLVLAPMVAPADPTTNTVLMTVQSVSAEADSAGRTNTRVTFTGPFNLPGDITTYGLYRSTQSMVIFPFEGYTAGNSYDNNTNNLHLASPARSIRVGDFVLEIASSSATPTVRLVTNYSEAVWYANNTPPTQPPSTGIPIGVLHAVVALTTLDKTTTSLAFAFRAVGTIVAEPAGPVPPATTLTLQTTGAFPPVATVGASVLLEDATGNGILTSIESTSPAQGRITLRDPTPSGLTLIPPLVLLFGLVPVSRGKTVAGEVLGSGDATVAGQVFTLQKSPLTYLTGADPAFPSSTLNVSINGVSWTEAASFYGQSPTAQVFVTRQTTDQKTEVVFGDGVSGARLPTGSGNVVATYRYGSGQASPPAGALTTILKPQQGLRSLRNPIAVSGGDDPASPDDVRAYAPASVLTFGRAISANDYEALAVQAPSVARARGVYDWDGSRQRAFLKVYVGDSSGAVASAQQALDAARDTNLPVQVVAAKGLDLVVTFLLVADPKCDRDAVEASVVGALTDPVSGFFSPRRMQIGQVLYESQFVAACLRVPGAVALHQLAFSNAADGSKLSGPRISPGDGGYFTLSPSNVNPPGAPNG